MGFFDAAFNGIKNTVTFIASEIERSANEVREIRQKYEELDDKDLIKIVHSDGFFGKSSKEKSIAFSTLKSRGLDAEDIKMRKP